MSEAALGRWPVEIEVEVAWGDMDAFGHVNHTIYLRWCESARIAYLDATGLLARMKSEGVGPILAHLGVDYRRPVVWPARVRVAVTVDKIGNTSMSMRYRVTQQPAGEVVAEAESIIVLVDYRSGAKVPVDAELRARIEALEASAVGR